MSVPPQPVKQTEAPSPAANPPAAAANPASPCPTKVHPPKPTKVTKINRAFAIQKERQHKPAKFDDLGLNQAENAITADAAAFSDSADSAPADARWRIHSLDDDHHWLLRRQPKQGAIPAHLQERLDQAAALPCGQARLRRPHTARDGGVWWDQDPLRAAAERRHADQHNRV